MLATFIKRQKLLLAVLLCLTFGAGGLLFYNLWTMGRKVDPVLSISDATLTRSLVNKTPAQDMRPFPAELGVECIYFYEIGCPDCELVAPLVAELEESGTIVKYISVRNPGSMALLSRLEKKYGRQAEFLAPILIYEDAMTVGFSEIYAILTERTIVSPTEREKR